MTYEGFTIFDIVNWMLKFSELISLGKRSWRIILFGEVDFVIETDDIVHPVSQKSSFAMFGPVALAMFQFVEKSIYIYVPDSTLYDAAENVNTW